MKKANKRFLCLLFVIGTIWMSAAVHAATPEEQAAADVLYQLGLFRGTENGYELDKNLTRAEAVTMIVRFLGEENTAIANADAYVFPFTDVPKWAKPYVGYAYVNDITKGVSESAFDSEAPVTSQQFLTFMLRILHYSDTDGDFVWDKPENLAVKAGLLTEIYADEFLRGNMVMVCKNALLSVYKDDDTPVWKTLCGKNLFTEEQYNTAMTDKKAENNAGRSGVRTGGSGRTPSKPKDNDPPSMQTETAGKATISEKSELSGTDNIFSVSANVSDDGSVINLEISLEGNVELCGFDLLLKYDTNLCKLKEWNTEYDLQIVGEANERSGSIAFNYAGIKNFNAAKKLLTASFEVIGAPGTNGSFSLQAEEVVKTNAEQDYEITAVPYTLTEATYTIQ